MNILLIFHHPPYGSCQSAETLDLALAASACEHQVNLLFMGAGVLQLLKNQDADKIYAKAYTKVLTGLSWYDIDTCYVDEISLQKYNLDSQQCLTEYLSVNPDTIHDLWDKADIIISG